MSNLLGNDDSRQAVKRSTALKPVVWMTAILTPATVATAIIEAPEWMRIFFCAATGFSVLLYLVTYVYLLVNDRNALRSEKYLLEKVPTGKPSLGEIQIQFQPNQPKLSSPSMGGVPLLEQQVSWSPREQTTARLEESVQK